MINRVDLLFFYIFASWWSFSYVDAYFTVPLTEHNVKYKRKINPYNYEDEMPVKTYFDNFYYAPVKIGGKTFNLFLDTGSSDNWVIGNDYMPPEYRQHRSTYNSNGKLLVPKQPFEIKYIDGNVCSGYLARDKFQIDKIEINNVIFAVINNESSEFDGEEKCDGLLGLAFSENAASKSTTNILKALQTVQFTFDLRKRYSKKPSELIFGNIMEKFPELNPTFHKVDHSKLGLWEVKLTSISLHEPFKQVHTVTNKQSNALIDTGSTYIHGPSKMVKDILQKIPCRFNNGQYTVDCAIVSTLPTIIFSIDNKKYELKGDDYVLKWFQQGHVTCYVGISSIDYVPPKNSFWILGNSFIRKYYAIFHYNGGSGEIAFANKSDQD